MGWSRDRTKDARCPTCSGPVFGVRSHRASVWPTAWLIGDANGFEIRELGGAIEKLDHRADAMDTSGFVTATSTAIPKTLAPTTAVGTPTTPETNTTPASPHIARVHQSASRMTAAAAPASNAARCETAATVCAQRVSNSSGGSWSAPEVRTICGVRARPVASALTAGSSTIDSRGSGEAETERGHHASDCACSASPARGARARRAAGHANRTSPMRGTRLSVPRTRRDRTRAQ